MLLLLQRNGRRSGLYQKRLNGAFRIKEHSVRAHIAAWILKGKSTAIVFGNTIHLHGISRRDFLADTKFLRHELKHVEQYRKHGRLKFILLYLWESWRHGYYNNVFEKEARLAETDDTIISRFHLQ